MFLLLMKTFLKRLCIWQILHVIHFICDKSMQTPREHHYRKQKESDFTSLLSIPPPSVRCCMKSNTPKVLKPESAWGGVKCKLWPAFTEWFSFLFLFFKRFHPELCELSRMIRYNQVIDKSLKASAIYDDAQIAWEQMNLSCHVMIS